MRGTGRSRLARGLVAPAVALCFLPALLLGACAAPPDTTTATIPAQSYEDAFHAARDALRTAHFDLERVDAAAGVITTLPRSSAGLATPWLDYDDSFSESVSDLIHRDRRRATVRFAPADDPNASALVDRRTLGVPLVMSVKVDVERTYVLGRRADPTSIRLISRTIDPQSPERLVRDQVGEDEELAARILTRIEDALQAKPAS